jgi:Acyl-CoA synthetases (AMP-forming)/AMP-acid ligases II
MTETNMNISNPYYGLRKAGTVGISLPGIEIRIVNEEGKEVEMGQIGTIELKGENIFKGYWGMEEKTKESFKDDGFFITGDLAKKDENGYFTIVGRDKDMIISGGLNVYPKEIEDVINQIPDISESAVIGINHYDFGEAVVALVISDNKKLEERYVLDLLKDKIAKYKQPKKIIFLEELPRNSMGKVQKNILREKYSYLFKG